MTNQRCLFRALTIPVALLLTAGCMQRESPAAIGDDGGGAAAAVPDFSGVWMAFSVESPDGGNQPGYSEQGEALLDAYAAQFRTIPEVGGNCVGTGVPSVMLSTVSYPIEMVQNESRILMVAELETQVRRIFIDGRDFPEVAFPQMVGHSLGRFEGDTLVIETTLLEPWELRPWPRSDEASAVERLYLTTFAEIEARPTGFVASLDRGDSNEVLVVDITLTDPVYYDGPQRRIAYFQRVDDNATAEYICSRGLWEELLEAERIE
jgi:hypothetical protein